MASSTLLCLPGLALAWTVAGCGAGPFPSATQGRTHFETSCAPCHRPDGQGVEGGAPPLTGSSWVSGPEERLIRIVLHGLRGPIRVGDRSYDREMLGFGQVLTDEQIASLLTFVREQEGAPTGAVAPSTVGRIRAATWGRTDYWTVEELLRGP